MAGVTDRRLDALHTVGGTLNVNTFISSLAAFALAGISTTAIADRTIISTGGVYGGPNQTDIYCYAFNPGTESYRISLVQLIKEDGSQVAYHGTCYPGQHAPFPLANIHAGRTCQISAPIANNSTYSCRWVFQADGTGVKPSVRGTMDVRDAQGHVLTSSQLR